MLRINMEFLKIKKNRFEEWMVHTANMIQRNLYPWEPFFNPKNNKKAV